MSDCRVGEFLALKTLGTQLLGDYGPMAGAEILRWADAEKYDRAFALLDQSPSSFAVHNFDVPATLVILVAKVADVVVALTQ